MNIAGHFMTITGHRWKVLKNCFKVGLYKQGLLHDLSKYSPAEFIIGCKYFQGNRSPNAAEREDKGFSRAWLHHKGRNKHHFEYWIDVDVKHNKAAAGMEMPVRFVVEMFMDRIAAAQTYEKAAYTDASALAYYNRSRQYHILHNNTKALLENLLTMLAEKGEKKTFAYIRKELLSHKMTPLAVK